MRRRRPFRFLRHTRSLAFMLGSAGASSVCAITDSAHAQSVAPTTWGFVSTRLDSRASHAVYTGYGYESAFIVGALFDNPRTGYSEQIIGIGGRATLGGLGSQFVVVAVAKAPESRYLQFYYLPTVAYRGVTVGTTIETYVPLDRTGVVQLAITPLSALAQAIGPLAIGASYELSAEAHGTTSHGAGPSIRVAVPGAELGADLLLGLRHAAGKLRLSFRAFY